MVPSESPDANRFPSELNAMLVECFPKRQIVTSANVPDPDRFVLAGGDNARSVWTKGDAPDL